MRRVVIIGNPGSGKSTLADALAARLAIPHVELDAPHHGPDWTPAPEEQFRRAVRAALDTADAEVAGGWVVCP